MFNHEAAAVDPETSIIYQTEDSGNSGFYRFVPQEKITAMGQLLDVKGKFQVMEIVYASKVQWNDVPNTLAKMKSAPQGCVRKPRLRFPDFSQCFCIFGLSP